MTKYLPNTCRLCSLVLVHFLGGRNFDCGVERSWSRRAKALREAQPILITHQEGEGAHWCSLVQPTPPVLKVVVCTHCQECVKWCSSRLVEVTLMTLNWYLSALKRFRTKLRMERVLGIGVEMQRCTPSPQQEPCPSYITSKSMISCVSPTTLIWVEFARIKRRNKRISCNVKDEVSLQTFVISHTENLLI